MKQITVFSPSNPIPLKHGESSLPDSDNDLSTYSQIPFLGRDDGWKGRHFRQRCSCEATSAPVRLNSSSCETGSNAGLGMVVRESTQDSLGAVTTQASRKGNTESSVVGSSTSVGSIVLKLDQRLADHGIRRSLDDGNIGVTSVGSSNVDLKGDLLAEAVLLDIVLVVVELEALAQPEVAVSGLEVLANDLLDALDVAVDVGGLLVEGLVSAGGLVGVAGPAGGGRLDEAVGGDERNESEDSGGVLHFGGSRYKSVLK
ncbi:hypothetical protein HG531_011215 [Fusarium graminearum]|nr:hypothetical protein HG531_011215 [Fusarium graminearum]